MKSLVSIYDPWTTMLENFFGSDLNSESLHDKSLSVKIKEEEDKTLVFAEVPGLKENQLHVEVKEGTLSVFANYDEKEEGEEHVSLRMGRYVWGSVIKGIDSENITATLDAGILTITLPKIAEVKPRRIEIAKK